MEEKDLNIIIIELSGIIAHYARVIRENTGMINKLFDKNEELEKEVKILQAGYKVASEQMIDAVKECARLRGVLAKLNYQEEASE